MAAHSPLFWAICLASLENKCSDSEFDTFIRLTENDVVQIGRCPSKVPTTMPRYPRGNRLRRAHHNIVQPQWRGHSH